MRLKLNKIKSLVVSPLWDIVSCTVFIIGLSSAAYGFKVTVNSTIPTGSGNYQTFDELLTAIENGTLVMSGGVDSVIFTDTATFSLTKNLSNASRFNGSIIFTSINKDPNMFPKLNHTAGDWYNFFDKVNVTFERVVFRGTTYFRSGQATRTRKFRNCVIRDFNASSFFQLEGNVASNTIFENCLFVNDTFTTAAINIATWAGTAPIIKIVNCTFYNVNIVFKTGGSGTYMPGSTNIFNNIFNKCGTVCSDTLLLRRITYSLTNESITKYGTGCVSDTSVKFVVATGKYKPEDWRPTMASPARYLGIDTVASIGKAPTVDTSDTIRIDTVGRRDAGCWDIRDTIIIVKQPKDTVVAEGNSVVFKVIVTSIEPLSYKWINVATNQIVSTTDSFRIATTTIAMD
ncbi:MAG: hypothetical protein N2053_11380, partial [Chitinispirillaceae bacterium]|nr:hypothetical protein [Chitinispirillaceae bacterium]